MSYKITKRVWGLKIAANEKLTLLALADFCNDQGGSCFPVVGTLSRMTGLGTRQIERCFVTHKRDGHLSIAYRTGMKSLYKLHPRHMDTPDARSGVSDDRPPP